MKENSIFPCIIEHSPILNYRGNEEIAPKKKKKTSYVMIEITYQLLENVYSFEWKGVARGFPECRW